MKAWNIISKQQAMSKYGVHQEKNVLPMWKEALDWHQTPMLKPFDVSFLIVMREPYKERFGLEP
jgi:hypothetical protein